MKDMGFDGPESLLKHLDVAAGRFVQDEPSAAGVRGPDRTGALKRDKKAGNWRADGEAKRDKGMPRVPGEARKLGSGCQPYALL
jgi:hypothetical protein